jgi:hypothetical protein
MDAGRLLTTIGLVRPARPGGFCPACRILMKALDGRPELARPTVAALILLAIAGVAWAATVQDSRSMAAMDGMDMGLGPIVYFENTFLFIMRAMIYTTLIS